MMGYIPMCVSIQSKLLPKSSPGPAWTGQVGRNKPNNPSRMINQLTLMLITLMGSYSCHRAVNNPIKPGEPWANNPKENYFYKITLINLKNPNILTNPNANHLGLINDSCACVVFNLATLLDTPFGLHSSESGTNPNRVQWCLSLTNPRQPKSRWKTGSKEGTR